MTLMKLILQLKSQLINNQKTWEIFNINTLSLKKEYEELIKKNNQLKSNYENLKGEKTIVDFKLKKEKLENNNYKDQMKTLKEIIKK